MNEISKLLITMYLQEKYSSTDKIRNIELLYYCKFDKQSRDDEKNLGLIGVSFERDISWTYSVKRINTIYIHNDYKYLLDDLKHDIKDNFKQIECRFRNKYGERFLNDFPETLYFDPDKIKFSNTLDARYNHFVIYNQNIGSVYLDSKFDLTKLYDTIGENLTLSPMLLEALERNTISPVLMKKLVENFGEDWVNTQRLIYAVSDDKVRLD